MNYLFAFTICICAALNGFSQLKPNEKPDIIYDTRPKAFKRVTFRLNGEELRTRQLRKVLLQNERSAPLFKKGQQQHAIGLPIALSGLILFQVGLSNLSGYDLNSNANQSSAAIMAGAGLLINIVGDIQLFKGTKNKRNAINAFNQISLTDSPDNQKDSTQKNAPIHLNPMYLNRNHYYLNGQKVSVKTIDNALSKSDKVKSYYVPLQKNKKIRNIGAVATGVFLSYPFIFRAKDLNTPMSELKNAGLMWASLGGFFVSAMTTGIADRNVKEFRYNAYRVFNDEIPYPFNRRHERIIEGVSKIKIGMGNYGYGFVVQL